MSEVISEAYRQQQIELHKNPNYGVASLSFAPIVAELLKLFKFRSVSDYGAGKQNLRKALAELGFADIDYRPYDPAFPEYGKPQPADVVCCIDVLEHIEPPLLDNVLADLHGIVDKVGFFTIHTGAAAKVLSDGRNAHLIQQPSSWWLKRLTDYFDVNHLQTLPNRSGFWVVVEKTRSRMESPA